MKHLMMTSQVTQVIKPHQFHPNYLWKTQYDFNYEGSPLQTHCGQLLDHTGRSSVLETGNAFSTAGNLQQSPHHWEILEDFLVWMQAQIIPIWDHWNYFPCMPQPFNSWVNLHKRGGETLEHYHSPCPLVVSCYLKCPPNSGNFLVRDPFEYHLFGTPSEPQEKLWTEIPVQTNDILIFPGWLKHKTQPNETDEDRIVLTLNYEGN